MFGNSVLSLLVIVISWNGLAQAQISTFILSPMESDSSPFIYAIRNSTDFSDGSNQIWLSLDYLYFLSFQDNVIIGNKRQIIGTIGQVNLPDENIIAGIPLKNYPAQFSERFYSLMLVNASNCFSTVWIQYDQAPNYLNEFCFEGAPLFTQLIGDSDYAMNVEFVFAVGVQYAAVFLAGNSTPISLFDYNEHAHSVFPVSTVNGISYIKGKFFIVRSGQLHHPSQIVFLEIFPQLAPRFTFNHITYLDGPSQNMFLHNSVLYWLQIFDVETGVLNGWALTNHTFDNATVSFSGNESWSTAQGFGVPGNDQSGLMIAAGSNGNFTTYAVTVEEGSYQVEAQLPGQDGTLPQKGLGIQSSSSLFAAIFGNQDENGNDQFIVYGF